MSSKFLYIYSFRQFDAKTYGRVLKNGTVCGIMSSSWKNTIINYKKGLFPMKKILSAILCGVLLLSLAACGGQVEDAVNNAADAAVDAVNEAAGEVGKAADEAAAEITEAAEEKAEEKVEEVVEEVKEEIKKRDSYDEILFCDDAADHTPVSLMNGATFGMHVKFPEGFMEDVTVVCPSWSNNVGSLTFKVFAWNTDFDTTVAGEALASETFEDYVDNDSLMMDLTSDSSRGIPAGEYLIWIGDGVDSSGSGVGFWAKGYPEDSDYLIEMFQNGKVVDTFGPEGVASIVIPAE